MYKLHGIWLFYKHIVELFQRILHLAAYWDKYTLPSAFKIGSVKEQLVNETHTTEVQPAQINHIKTSQDII